MPTNSHPPSQVAAAQSNPQPVRFLIPRSQRRIFFFQFTLMTVVGWLVGGVFSIAVEKILWQSLLPMLIDQAPALSFWTRLVGNVVFAVVFAADQALVMRRYLSGWLWLLATSMGWLLAHAVSTTWINYIGSVANSLRQTLTPETALTWGFLSTIPYIISGIWLGFLQWLVLRRYAVKTWWWSIFPCLPFFCISVVIWLLSLIQNWLPEFVMSWIEQGFTAMILGVIPAIGLCTLKKQLQPQTGISSSSKSFG